MFFAEMSSGMSLIINCSVAAMTAGQHREKSASRYNTVCMPKRKKIIW
jgi:hypothetical protein